MVVVRTMNAVAMVVVVVVVVVVVRSGETRRCRW